MKEQEASMKDERTTPLRERMNGTMRIRGMDDKAQKAHVRAIKDSAGILKRSPDMATPNEPPAYQLRVTDTGVQRADCGVEVLLRHDL